MPAASQGAAGFTIEGSQPPRSNALESQPSDETSDVARYREDQNEQLESEGELWTPFGMQLREGQRTLNSGEEADGSLITAVGKEPPGRGGRLARL